MVGVDFSFTLSSAVTLIVTGVFSVFAGTSAVTVGVSDAVSAGLLLNTPVAPATESVITAMIATIIPTVCGLWDLTHFCKFVHKASPSYQMEWSVFCNSSSFAALSATLMSDMITPSGQ
jgi:hypothetical protein